MCFESLTVDTGLGGHNMNVFGQLKEMLRRRKQKRPVSTYDAGVPPDRPP